MYRIGIRRGDHRPELRQLEEFGPAWLWYAPVDGHLLPPASPGFGYELDEEKARVRTELA